MTTACGLNCDTCPAAAACGRVCNFCVAGLHREHDDQAGCAFCNANPLLRMDIRRAVIDQLGGLEFLWPRQVQHLEVPDLPVHLPVLVQAYADSVDLPWVALHAGRVLGATGGSLTPKHRHPLRDVYRVAPGTKLALEFYVEDRVLEGFWANRRSIISSLAGLEFDLVLAPSYSVWYDHSRFEQLVQQRRAFIVYHELLEAGLPAIPDVGWSRFEPDGRRWADWINNQPGLQAVSLFCDGRKVHASQRALRETVEDIALFHRAVRPEVAFVLGGVHAPERLVAYRDAAPGRRLTICNGMAYALAQRRRRLGENDSRIARSARDCFLHNCARNDRAYAEILTPMDEPVAV